LLSEEEPVQHFIEKHKGYRNLENKFNSAQFSLLCSYVGNQVTEEHESEKNFNEISL